MKTSSAVHRSAPIRPKFEKDLAEIKTKIEAIEVQLVNLNFF
jgi:hypothetical protein